MERRSDGLLLVSLYHLVCGLFSLLWLCLVAAMGAGLVFAAAPGKYSSDPTGATVLAIITLAASGILLTVAAANLIVGWGLWRRREWARIGALVLAIFRLPNIPLGTVAGILIIWYLVQPEAKDRFDALAQTD